jgi:O-antigen ligase
MLTVQSEKTLTRTLAWGATLVSIFVMWSVVTDPVNVTKHFLLGAVALSAALVALASGYRLIWRQSKLIVVLLVGFLLLSLSAVINSPGPLSQNFYGSYGRNTGFMAYLFLLLILLSTLVIRSRKNFESIVKALIVAGLINVFYCFWVIVFGDFIGWSNPYGNILGTFGNPNFIGAFLGIFVSVFAAYLLAPGLDIKIRIGGALIILVALFEIKDSNAIQGIVVSAGGFAIVLFFFIRSRTKSLVPILIYIGFVAVMGVFAILGALQKGPLTEYIYKTSVSLRGEYWQAGINMAREFPLTGVGMDTYGDWYRRLREPSAIILPGPNTVTNAAHNVNLDLLASGGWPLFIVYLLILLVAAISIIKVIRRSKAYDWVFVALATGWVCYQVQALISINQIGLAIWGWLLTGAVIAYEISTREVLAIKPLKVKSGYSGANISPQLIGGVGLVIGGLLAVPPLSADMTWRSALQSQDIAKVEAALVPSYLNPANTAKYSQAVQTFESSKLPEQAYKYAQIAVAFNPDAFDAWKVLYFISKSTQADKDLALANMKRLDPLSPNVLG